jgi:phage baseplate assembly protein V
MSQTDPIAQLMRRIEELERRVRRTVYQGLVTDVDKAKRMVRVDDGMADDDADPNKTDWLYWVELAGSGSGSLKTKTLPVVGQQVTVISPSGTPESAIVVAGHFTDDNTKPDSDDDDYVRMNGDGAVSRMKGKTIEHKIGDKASVLLEEAKITLKVGNSTIVMDESSITLTSTAIATVGTTNLGLDDKSDTNLPKVVTLTGPAKKTFAKPG